MGWWVGGYVGRKQKSQKKKFIGELVGRWVVVLVGWLVGWPKGIGIGHIWDFFSARTNCCFLRWNGKE
jgi:hypothetical protein